MSSPAAPPSPVESESRIAALDVARGLALFGILLMNITAFGLPWAYGDPTNFGGSEGADLWAWLITTVGFEGTQRGLFSLLFGAGLAILADSLERSGRANAHDVFLRRNYWLVLFGIIHSYILLWTGEILYYYGATVLFVYGFRNARPRTLITLAAGGLLLGAAWSGVEARKALKTHAEFVVADSARAAGDSLSKEQRSAIEAWEKVVKSAKPDSAKLQEEIDAKQGSYWDVLVFQAPQNMYFQSWWFYRYFFDIWSMMLLGIAVYRTGVITAQRSTGTYLLMVVLGYGVGLTVNVMEARHILAEQFSVLSFKRTAVTYDVGRLAMTLGHLGVIMLYCRATWWQGLRRALAAVGRMAFSNYIATSIVCALIFYGFGFGLYAQLARHQLYYVVAGIWIAQLIVSPLWLARYRFGPLEYVWRWLTYQERPRFRGPASGSA